EGFLLAQIRSMAPDKQAASRMALPADLDKGASSDMAPGNGEIAGSPLKPQLRKEISQCDECDKNELDNGTGITRKEKREAVEVGRRGDKESGQEEAMDTY
ncbi:16662_t:CDS:2, partial [Acaulospora colombiana]